MRNQIETRSDIREGRQQNVPRSDAGELRPVLQSVQTVDENRRREGVVQRDVHRVGVAYHPDLLLAAEEWIGFRTFLGSVLALKLGKNMNPWLESERLWVILEIELYSETTSPSPRQAARMERKRIGNGAKVYRLNSMAGSHMIFFDAGADVVQLGQKRADDAFAALSLI